MMKCHNLYSILCWAFMLAACETVTDLEVPRLPPLMTANAFFGPDSVWKVELTTNRYILDTTYFEAVPDAAVSIKQQGNTVATLNYRGADSFTGNGIYTAESAYPEAGQEYTLEVAHPSLGTISASSQVPVRQTAIISAVIDTTDVRVGADFGPNEIAYAITVRLKDPPGEDFYSLYFVLSFNGLGAQDINDDGWADLIVYEITNVAGEVYSSDPVVNNPADDFADELMFKDVAFDGGEYVLKAYVRLNIESPAIYRDYFKKNPTVFGENVYDLEGNIVYTSGDTLKAQFYTVLRSTTETYYQYRFTSDLQISVKNNPFAQPVQVFNNVENGLGIFAGYDQIKKEVTIR